MQGWVSFCCTTCIYRFLAIHQRHNILFEFLDIVVQRVSTETNFHSLVKPFLSFLRVVCVGSLEIAVQLGVAVISCGD